MEENQKEIPENDKKSYSGNKDFKTKKRTQSIKASSTGWHKDLKKGFLINEKIHKDRLNPHYKLNLNNNNKIKITPLGGLGEIGGNIMVMENENTALLIDVGMSFPDNDMHGVDILVPDFTYIRQIKHKIAGIIITHGHEDHIGAMPYLFKELQFPIYGTSLALEMIGAKFDEHKIKQHRNYFRVVEKRRPIKIGDFDVEWMHITHSIIDASALAITSDVGTIIHTGDFKIDHTPVDGYPTDLHRFAYYGDKGVMLLLSDSTNSHNIGSTKSEKVVGPTFEKIFTESNQSRIIMSTFSSNIHRIVQAIECGLKHNRKICIIGRSMEKNLSIAMDLGYVQFPKNIFIDAHNINKYDDNEILIVTTGSQGEPMSALYRMAIFEHRHIKIKNGDQIILSAKAIPGNEGSVSGIINNLQKAGAKVAYQNYQDIHVSGHAGQEEQKLLLRLSKPKFFLPVHGEYNHVNKHKDTAISCGIPERNIILMNDGDSVEVNAKYMRKIKGVKTGKVYIDNQINYKIDDEVVLDRQKLANEGVVMIIAQISQDEKIMTERPKVSSFGLIGDKSLKYFAKEIEDLLEIFLQNSKHNVLKNTRALENELRQVVRKHIFRKYKKYPLIIPTFIIM